MATYLTEHTIYCRIGKKKVADVLHPGVEVVGAPVEVEKGTWRVRFVTPTNETFLKRMNVLKGGKGAGDAE